MSTTQRENLHHQRDSLPLLMNLDLATLCRQAIEAGDSARYGGCRGDAYGAA